MDLSEVKERRLSVHGVSDNHIDWLIAELEERTAEVIVANCTALACSAPVKRAFETLTSERDELKAEVAGYRKMSARYYMTEAFIPVERHRADLTRAREENERLKGEVLSWQRANARKATAGARLLTRHQKELTAARAEGYAQGVEATFPLVLPAIRSYRSNIAACDVDGNGAELTDILATGYGDEDISNALKELDSLADHICGYIICDSRNRAIAPAAPVITTPARTYEDGMRDAAGIADKHLHEEGYISAALRVKRLILAVAGNPPTVGEVVTCEWVWKETPNAEYWESSCGLRAKSFYDSLVHNGVRCQRCHKSISIKEALNA